MAGIIASGKVQQIYATKGRTYIRLADIPADVTPPQKGYFELDKDHDNYNALYSLALAAAVNGYTLRIRIEEEEMPTDKRPKVYYMVVDW